MSHPQPTAESDELSVSALDPSHHAIVPSDKQQDLVFRSIKAIDPRALEPHGVVSLTAVRRTPKGIRPKIWVKLTESETAVVFEVVSDILTRLLRRIYSGHCCQVSTAGHDSDKTLRTGQSIQVHVPIDSWRIGNCDSEAVRAAIQRAYRQSVYFALACPDPLMTNPVNTTRNKPGSVTVRPGTVCREILSKRKPRTPYIGKLVNRVKEWRRSRNEKADKRRPFNQKETGGDVDGREEENQSVRGGEGFLNLDPLSISFPRSISFARSISIPSRSRNGSGSGSGELTYSESRTSATSYAPRNRTSFYAGESSTSIGPPALSLEE